MCVPVRVCVCVCVRARTTSTKVVREVDRIERRLKSIVDQRVYINALAEAEEEWPKDSNLNNGGNKKPGQQESQRGNSPWLSEKVSATRQAATATEERLSLRGRPSRPRRRCCSLSLSSSSRPHHHHHHPRFFLSFRSVARVGTVRPPLATEARPPQRRSSEDLYGGAEAPSCSKPFSQ